MLQTDHNMEPLLAAELAKNSAGCPGRAIRAKDDTDVSLIRDRANAWVSDFLQGSRNQIYSHAETLRSIVPKSSPDASTRQTVTKGIQAVADAFGKELSSETDSVDALMDCVALSMQAAHAVQRNGNQQIVTEALVAKLSKRCHRR
jgi:hypothetical protein